MSSDESVPVNLYANITLSFKVATTGVLVIYSIFRLLEVEAPPPPTIVNFCFGVLTSFSKPSFSISYKTKTLSPMSGFSASL